MVGLVICGHGRLAASMLESAEMILGKLEPEQNLDELHQLIGDAIALIEHGDGVLVLLDLYGGTPSNATALHFQRVAIEAVTGMNLPMLLEVLLGRYERTLAELTALAEEIGRQGVVNVRAALIALNGPGSVIMGGPPERR
jgi:PTS system mannose-specific IIA component